MRALLALLALSTTAALRLGAPLAARPVVTASRAVPFMNIDEVEVEEAEQPVLRKGLWGGDREAPECC